MISDPGGRVGVYLYAAEGDSTVIQPNIRTQKSLFCVRFFLLAPRAVVCDNLYFRTVHKNLCLDASRRVRAEIFISVDSSVFLDFFHLRPDRMNNHLHALLFL